MEEIFFTLNQAANQANVSKSTISRAINNGKLPNTQQQPDGSYRIPLSDLVAAGYLDTVRPAKNNEREHEGVSSVPGEHIELRHKLELVEQQLKAKEEQLQQLERLIATQERTLNALENSLKALEAPKATEDTIEDSRETTVPEPEQKKTTAHNGGNSGYSQKTESDARHSSNTA
ncbi:MAG: helix-turn-helix domain-containing protein [Corynebacterium sp.]|nr:helix-turn-helix domain-containing protein [Corynebacterium sp.]